MDAGALAADTHMANGADVAAPPGAEAVAAVKVESAEAPAPQAQEQDAAGMLLGLSADGQPPEGMDPEAALQLQLQQQQQLQLLLAQAQVQAAAAAAAAGGDGAGGEGAEQPQLLSLLQLADPAAMAAAAAAAGAGDSEGGDGGDGAAALAAQLSMLQQLQLAQAGMQPMLGLGAVSLLPGGAAFAAPDAGGADGDEPSAKRARVDGGEGGEGEGGEGDGAGGLQVAALTAEQQVQLQAMMSADPNLASQLAAAGSADGAAVLEGIPLALDGAGAEAQMQQLMALQAQILQQGIESGELTPGPDGMLSPEQLHQLQLQTQLAQLQQVQMQLLLQQQLQQIQEGGGEIVLGPDGTPMIAAPAGADVSGGSAPAPPRGARGGRGGGGREPAVVRRHGAAPERTITRDSLRELFHLPIEEAAKALNIGQTMLKHYCRKFGIPRWPFRKRQSIGILIQSIEDFSRNRPVNVEPALSKLRSFLDLIDDDPNVDLDGPIKRLRQAFFKEAYKSRQRANKGEGGDRSTRAQRNQQRTDQWLEQLCHAIVQEQAGDTAPAGINYGAIAAAADAEEAALDSEEAAAAAAAAMANAQMLQVLQAGGAEGAAALAINPDGTVSGLPPGGLMLTPEQLQQLQLAGVAGADGAVLPGAQPIQLPLGPDGEPIQIATNEDGTIDEVQMQQLVLMQQQLQLQALQQLQAQLEQQAAAGGAEGEEAAAHLAAMQQAVEAAAAAGDGGEGEGAGGALEADAAAAAVAAAAEAAGGAAFDAEALAAAADAAAAHAPPGGDEAEAEAAAAHAAALAAAEAAEALGGGGDD